MRAARTARDWRSDGGNVPPPIEVRLLPAWSKPFAVFVDNLSDLIFRPDTSLGPTRVPCYGFWHDIDLVAPFPWSGLRRSVLLHAALLCVVYAVSIWPRTGVHLADSRPLRAMTDVQLSPYLPELHGVLSHHRIGGKEDPVPARQEIRSVPEAFDNLHQNIVTPPKVKLQSEIELPNLVAYEKAPEAPPLDASSRSAILQVPATLPKLAERAPLIVQLRPQRALSVPPSTAQPAPEIAPSRASDLAQLLPPADNPALSVPQLAPRAPAIVQLKPQRSPSSVQPRAVQAAPELARETAPDLAQLIPQRATPALPGAPAGDTRSPNVVALSSHPADVQDEVTIPEGNLSGAFAASPSSHPGATGMPGAGGSTGIGAHDETGKKVNGPPGITVGAPPTPASEVGSASAAQATAASPTAASPMTASSDAQPDIRKKLLASARPSAIASVPPQRPMAHESTAKLTDLENHILGGRRSYTLVVNMPNLNVPVGSWIIRYVDRKQGAAAEPITAPEVIRKTDPAYPSEVFVHGVVVLTAVIRSDGTVSDVAVVQSLYPELDRNAAEALSRWVFRPALKDGEPIELEAVITVPFRTR